MAGIVDIHNQQSPSNSSQSDSQYDSQDDSQDNSSNDIKYDIQAGVQDIPSINDNIKQDPESQLPEQVQTPQEPQTSPKEDKIKFKITVKFMKAPKMIPAKSESPTPNLESETVSKTTEKIKTVKTGFSQQKISFCKCSIVEHYASFLLRRDYLNY